MIKTFSTEFIIQCVNSWFFIYRNVLFILQFVSQNLHNKQLSGSTKIKLINENDVQNLTTKQYMKENLIDLFTNLQRCHVNEKESLY